MLLCSRSLVSVFSFTAIGWFASWERKEECFALSLVVKCFVFGFVGNCHVGFYSFHLFGLFLYFFLACHCVWGVAFSHVHLHGDWLLCYCQNVGSHFSSCWTILVFHIFVKISTNFNFSFRSTTIIHFQQYLILQSYIMISGGTSQDLKVLRL